MPEKPKGPDDVKTTVPKSSLFSRKNREKYFSGFGFGRSLKKAVSKISGNRRGDPETELLDAADAIATSIGDFSLEAKDKEPIISSWEKLLDAHTLICKKIDGLKKSETSRKTELEQKQQVYEKAIEGFVKKCLRDQDFKNRVLVFDFFLDKKDMHRRNENLKKFLFMEDDTMFYDMAERELAQVERELREDISEILERNKDRIIASISEKAHIDFGIKKRRGISGYIKRRAENTIFSAVDSSIKSLLKSEQRFVLGEYEEIKNQLLNMRPEHALAILSIDNELDYLPLNLKIVTSLPGKVLDPNKFALEEMTLNNFLVTTREGIGDSLKLATQDKVELAGRTARLALLIGGLLTALALSAIAILFPPSVPFVIAAAVFVAVPTVSFLILPKDPLTKFRNFFSNVFNAKKAKEFVKEHFEARAEFNEDVMPKEVIIFLQNINPDLKSKLLEHFRGRAQQLEHDILNEKKKHRGNCFAKSKHNNDFILLNSDWQELIVKADYCRKMPNHTGVKEFHKFVDKYLMKRYLSHERPMLIEAAMKLKNDRTLRFEEGLSAEVEAVNKLKEISNASRPKN